ncbi:MAG: hypothetical protein JO328_05660 [Hyphomicrobiales bacterium]|nr:hypothetical protein [Hyphomicrobiales bacterium]MBV8826683.1 hypothetical protein [Hyphomicrobiales bacterium]
MPELATKVDLLAIRDDIRAMKQRLRASIRGSPERGAGFSELNARIEILILRLTLRFGIMWAIGILILLIIVKHK